MRTAYSKTRLHPLARAINVVTALAFYFSLGAPYVVRAQEAQAPVVSVELTEGASDEAAADREAWSEAGEPAEAEQDTASEALAEEDRPVAERALPYGEAKSAVTPQAIALPKAEGSIEGMGESFTPSLSAGTATFSIPIALPSGRAGVQPSLALSYSTGAGNGPVGIGWSLAVPFIARQTDKGLPRYVESSDGRWHEEEDTFIYNGGQELVPVDNARATQVDGAPVPAELASWQQYRARVEGAFMRFFRSPDGLRWVVQDKSGARFDFGVLSDGEGPVEALTGSPDALLSEHEGGAGRVFSWSLTRMSDAHGSTVYYRYVRDQGQRYVSDIYYVSPAACAAPTPAGQLHCGRPLTGYGRRVHFVYEEREDAFDSYLTTWRVTTGLRLRRIEVTAREPDAAERSLVRRYHLGYDGSSFLSLLETLQIEGRPEISSARSQMPIGDRLVPESALGDAVIGSTLPPMRFAYTQPAATSAAAAGFSGIDATVRRSSTSPPHSVDEARSDLFDVNSDGLPDLIVTDPARYRTADDEPAVGVFFNGFSGQDAAPSRAGEFSAAVAVPMPSNFSDVMHLGNMNVAAMDIDGDGRSDLLHMPRAQSYSYFTPTRGPDGAVPPVSPAHQLWRYSRVPVSLSDGDIDPRVDFGRDGRFFKAVDVDNDHLIDLVRTTGSNMQTWLNLGRYPEGDGLFGSANWDGEQWRFSTEPITSCLLHDGLPLDFEDPQLRLADMNGDGLQDIVELRQGRVVYWPGRGPGSWGEGDASCTGGAGEDGGVEMADAPIELNAELDSVFLADLNHDGADDVVQVRFDAIDVWWNRAGRSFTERVVAQDTPFAPSYAPALRFSDVDGSGTIDIVYGRGSAWSWIDPMGGRKPRMLARIENGLGGLTEVEYSSSVEDYLRDLTAAAACTDAGCERFTWSTVRGECDQKIELAGGGCARRSGGSPVTSTVVRAMTMRDQLDQLGRDEFAKRTEYAYHDGYFEGIEHEFRGFGAADAIAIGGPGQETSITRSYFHQGRRPTEIASDRTADNPDEALKSREHLTEVFDRTGTYLSTALTAFTVRELMRGLNGIAVSYAFAHRTDEVRYDTAPFTAAAAGASLQDPLSAGSLDFVAVQREMAGSGVNVHPAESAGSRQLRHIRMRATGYAHLANVTDEVDNAGNTRRNTAYGRLRGEFGETASEAIIHHSVPVRIDPSGAAGQWLWRTQESYVTGHGDEGQRLKHTINSYSPIGELLSARQPVTLGTSVPALVFNGDSDPDSGSSQPFDPEDALSGTAYDGWGNPVRSCAGATLGPSGTDLSGCLRLNETEYDSVYQQFPTEESIAVAGEIGALRWLSTQAVWDQGLAAPIAISDPNRLQTLIEHDGFGRLSSLTPPNVYACAGSSVPTTRVSYDIAVDGLPISVVTTRTEQSCASLGADTLISRSYVDGLARARARVVEAEDPNEPSVSTRVQRSGITTFHDKGGVRETYQSDLVQTTIDEIGPEQALALPQVPATIALYDAFDRPSVSIAEDGSRSTMRYHALSQDSWDPLDLDASSPHYGTPSTDRQDGHGRRVDQVLRNRQSAGAAIENYRLFTTYRADGLVTALQRAQTSTDGERTASMVLAGRSSTRSFMYDNRGRRIGGQDPDTDAPGQPAGSRGWRYLFNRVDDLVAVRDPRGCGQNFFYDRAGRLIGEDYVRCGEAQVGAESWLDELPAGSIALSDAVESSIRVDVRYYFDEFPEWFSSSEGFDVPPASANRMLGRATGLIDRGQRSVLAYDDRGNVIWQARQMAVIPNAQAIPLTIGNPPQVVTNDASPATAHFYDSHTHVVEHRHDHAGRARSAQLPIDPDYAGTAPRIGGLLDYNARGLPSRGAITYDGIAQPVAARIEYTRDGLTERVVYGDTLGGQRTPTVSTTQYDIRRRPERVTILRHPTALPDPNPTTGRPLGAVSVISDQRLAWDTANNLVAIEDLRDPNEWRSGFRPTSYTAAHDALYRVTGVEYDYTRDDGARVPVDTFVDYRAQLQLVAAEDPMRTRAAPRVTASPSSRVTSLTYEYDWLANMVDWTDDGAQFYERSLGRITNGHATTGDRPTALRFASDLPQSSQPYSSTANRGGYVEADYGVSGNLVSLTVHAQCRDVSTSQRCYDPGPTNRLTQLRAGCGCLAEQHYQYRYDELNRLVDARRYDRVSGAWNLAARQRYRYDAANQRAIKQTMDVTSDASGEVEINPAAERVALYVYPGDFERRGLVRIAGSTISYEPSATWETESQYLVAGARVVSKVGGQQQYGVLDREMRATVDLSDVISSTTAVIDLVSGSLVETSNYYPNGARESYRAPDTTGEAIAAEPKGFTGKEADEEVGLTYFGARYLVPRLGRWTTPDPLSVHAAGGGETGNSYHYVSGNLLQARDPFGLSSVDYITERTNAAFIHSHSDEQAETLADMMVHDEYYQIASRIDHYAFGRDFEDVPVNGGAKVLRDSAGRIEGVESATTSADLQDPVYLDAYVNQPKMVLAGAGGLPRGLLQALSKQVAGEAPTPALKQVLRKLTPSASIRRMINRAPTALKKDPALGFMTKVLEADHIVAFKRIINMPGFTKLTGEQMKAVLNYRRNFVGLGKSSNASKGEKSWFDWTEHKLTGKKVNTRFRAEMQKEELRLERELQGKIDKFVSENEAAARAASTAAGAAGAATK